MKRYFHDQITLKIYMLKKQFKLTKKETDCLASINILIIRFHLEAWFIAPDVSSSLNNDLRFVKDLFNYKNENRLIAEAAPPKITNYLWYLNDENVALSFFDLDVSYETKKNGLFFEKCNEFKRTSQARCD